MGSLWRRGYRIIEGSQISTPSRQLLPGRLTFVARSRAPSLPNRTASYTKLPSSTSLLKANRQGLTAIQIVLLSRQWHD